LTAVTGRRKPAVGITVGDPAGIGPEIALKAAADPRVTTLCEPVLYGPHTPDALRAFAPGVLSPAAGRAAYDAIVAATEDARAGRIDAIATAPINKEAFALAGLPWRGHTDLFASLTGVRRAVMMFYAQELRVVLATVTSRCATVPSLVTAS
jgi:4-hydroxythreonine-4-phosphate dehydrogenase